MRYAACGKIIHVMLDEKFNDMAIRQFEEVGAGINEYWVTSNTLVYTKSHLARKCRQKDLVLQLSRPEVKGVIFHSLPSMRYGLLRMIPEDKCVVWLGWGYDYYSLLNHENEDSRILAKTNLLQTPSLSRRAKKTAICIFNKFRPSIAANISDLKRVDYFSPVLDIEYEMVRRHVPLTAKYVPWNYGTAEDDLSQPNMGLSAGINILAGNSASASNNHVELFEAIRNQVDLTGRKVFAPLSYGDSDYRHKVISQGQRILGDAFVPLIEFMPKEKYLETIRSCGFIMMNHLRQQALGNICMAMLMGAKVYLNDKNPLSNWLGLRGAVFGSIDKLDMEPLSIEAREKNYRLIHSHWGRNAQRQKTRRLLEVIFDRGIFCE